jgi:hypothetical protein
VNGEQLPAVLFNRLNGHFGTPLIQVKTIAVCERFVEAGLIARKTVPWISCNVGSGYWLNYRAGVGPWRRAEVRG